jgi:outer membrane protein assembly factor BamB
VASESGDVFVTRMGTEFELLAENLLTDEFFVSSPVVVDDTLYLRSLERLFCIAEEDAAAVAGARAGVIWPSYRGPRASGVSDGHRLATTWSVADGTNVKWKTPIPGLAHSSPVISGDSLFVTSAEKEGEAELKVGLYGSVDPVEDDSEHDFTVYCVDRNDGSIKWRRSAWRGVPAVKRHPKGSHAASSPATDGKRVVAFFGAEGLYCYSTDGELKWKRDLGKLRAGWYERHTPDWGFASSPVIHEDLVLVQCDVIDDSFVAALSLEDGSDVWRTTREGVVPAWSTPTVDIREGRSQVIVNGYLRAAGYDLRSGRELWRIGGGGDIPVPTPIIAHDLVFLTSAHGRMRPIHAVHPMALGEIPTSPADTEHLAWSYPRRGNYMQTPIAYGDELYCCNDAGVVGCYDVRTGEEHYRQRLGSGGSGFTASAVAGDGKVYFTSEEGAIHVVRAGRTFEVVAVNEMGEECMATPAIAEGVLYWRTRGQVVAIEARAP